MSHRNELMEKPFLALKRAYQPQFKPYNAHICVDERGGRSIKYFPRASCNDCRLSFDSYDIHLPEDQIPQKYKRKSANKSSLAKEENNGNVA